MDIMKITILATTAGHQPMLKIDYAGETLLTLSIDRAERLANQLMDLAVKLEHGCGSAMSVIPAEPLKLGAGKRSLPLRADSPRNSPTEVGEYPEGWGPLIDTDVGDY